MEASSEQPKPEEQISQPQLPQEEVTGAAAINAEPASEAATVTATVPTPSVAESTEKEKKESGEGSEDSDDDDDEEVIEESPCGRYIKRREVVKYR